MIINFEENSRKSDNSKIEIIIMIINFEEKVMI